MRYALVNKRCNPSTTFKTYFQIKVCSLYSNLFSLQQPEGCQDCDGVFSPAATRQERDLLTGDQWVTSTPDAQDSELVSFDGGRVRAWLGVQNLASQEMMSSCSKAVQTEGEMEMEVGEVTYIHTVETGPKCFSLIILSYE